MAPTDAKQAAQPARTSRAKRLWRWLAALLVPVLLVVVLFKTPQWVNDYKLNSLAGRILAYPAPPGTEIDEGEVDGSIGVEGRFTNQCRYRLRFSVETALSATMLRDYYRQAEIAPAHPNGLFEVFVWTSADRPASPSTYGLQPMIVEFQNLGQANGGDIRCW